MYNLIDRQAHILIAGATGSGKTVLLRHILRHLYTRNNQFILIDPKRIELTEYRHNKKSLIYVCTNNKYIHILNIAVAEMEKRYKDMAHGLPLPCPLYIVIDELADIFINAPDTKKPLLKIAQLGRAAGLHIIACTQRPTRELLPMAIKVNFDCRIALRVGTATDSRNILDCTGAEQLPRFGYCLIKSPENLTPKIYHIPPP